MLIPRKSKFQQPILHPRLPGSFEFPGRSIGRFTDRPYGKPCLLPLAHFDAELEAQSKHLPSVAWARAYQQAAIDYVPSLTVNDTIIDCKSTSDNDAFLENGYPAFLVIENSLPDIWDANTYFHKSEDASDRLANDPDSPSGVTYNFAFATDVTRTAVALIAQEARLAPKPAQR